jgi:hypothetical protein
MPAMMYGGMPKFWEDRKTGRMKNVLGVIVANSCNDVAFGRKSRIRQGKKAAVAADTKLEGYLHYNYD